MLPAPGTSQKLDKSWIESGQGNRERTSSTTNSMYVLPLDVDEKSVFPNRIQLSAIPQIGAFQGAFENKKVL
eukprot:scaffold142942_cov19-Tisochrysis_lutea.AAC.1